MHVYDEPMMVLHPAVAERLGASRSWLAVAILAPALVLLGAALVAASVTLAGELSQVREAVDRLEQQVRRTADTLNGMSGGPVP